MAPDGQSLRIRLRPNVKFHDGSAVTTAIVAQVLQAKLPRVLGPAFKDVINIKAISDIEIDITQRRWSPFLVESLDIDIEKPDAPGVGTGPFVATRNTADIVMNANDAYYLGPPSISRIVMRSYPTVRAAWAEMLRGQVDMLLEVGLDAIDSLEASSQIAVYKFPRNYAYIIALNTRTSTFHSRELRQALNTAIDRSALIEQALYGHGRPANGPVLPNHWAFRPDFPAFKYAPAAAAALSGGRFHFKCILPEGAVFERIALTTAKQLAAVGVTMEVEALPLNQVVTRVTAGDFEAALLDAQIAPTMSREYQWWHTGGSYNLGAFSSPKVDATLDTIRYAGNDTEYAAAVLDFQRAILDDPPAVFLAWGERVRAVSRRFDVASEPDRDVLSSLRLWKPATDQHTAKRN